MHQHRTVATAAMFALYFAAFSSILAIEPSGDPNEPLPSASLLWRHGDDVPDTYMGTEEENCVRLTVARDKREALVVQYDTLLTSDEDFRVFLRVNGSTYGVSDEPEGVFMSGVQLPQLSPQESYHVYIVAFAADIFAIGHFYSPWTFDAEFPVSHPTFLSEDTAGRHEVYGIDSSHAVGDSFSSSIVNDAASSVCEQTGDTTNCMDSVHSAFTSDSTRVEHGRHGSQLRQLSASECSSEFVGCQIPDVCKGDALCQTIVAETYIAHFSRGNIMLKLCVIDTNTKGLCGKNDAADADGKLWRAVTAACTGANWECDPMTMAFPALHQPRATAFEDIHMRHPYSEYYCECMTGVSYGIDRWVSSSPSLPSAPTQEYSGSGQTEYSHHESLTDPTTEPTIGQAIPVTVRVGSEEEHAVRRHVIIAGSSKLRPIGPHPDLEMANCSVYDGTFVVHYTLEPTHFDVTLSFQSTSDALTAALAHAPIPPLVSDAFDTVGVASWPRHEVNWRPLPLRRPSTSMLDRLGGRSHRFAVALTTSNTQSIVIKQMASESLDPRGGLFRLRSDNDSRHSMQGNTPTFWVWDSRNGHEGDTRSPFEERVPIDEKPRHPQWGESPCCGHWYNSTYRVEVGVDAQAAKQSVESSWIAPSVMRLETPYSLTPVSVLIHDAQSLFQKPPHQCNIDRFRTLIDVDPRFIATLYVVAAPNYTDSQAAFRFFPVPMSCVAELRTNPSFDGRSEGSNRIDKNDRGRCWVDPSALDKVLTMEKHGFVRLGAHASYHVGAEWLNLTREESIETYREIVDNLTAIGSQTAIGNDGIVDVTPAWFSIGEEALHGLRSLGLKSISGTSGPQTIMDPGLTHTGRLVNHRWHYIRELDMAYIEQPMAFTWSERFYPRHINGYMDSSLPMVFYMHGMDWDEDVETAKYVPGHLFPEVLERFVERAMETQWMFADDLGVWVYANAKVTSTWASVGDDTVVVEIENTGDATLYGLAFEVVGGHRGHVVHFVTATAHDTTVDMNVTTCKRAERQVWVDVPPRAHVTLTVILGDAQSPSSPPDTGLLSFRRYAAWLTPDNDTAVVRVYDADANIVAEGGFDEEFMIPNGSYDAKVTGGLDNLYVLIDNVVVNGGRTVIGVAK